MQTSVHAKSCAVNKKICLISILLCSVAMLVLWNTRSFAYYTLHIKSEKLSPLNNRLNKNNSSSEDTVGTDLDVISSTLQQVSSVQSQLNVHTKVESSESEQSRSPVSNSDIKSTILKQGQNINTSNGPNKSGMKVLSNKKIVIVLAYMRTGSTLTASLLQEYNKAFYVFEPIRYIIQAFKSKNVTLKYLNGTKKLYDNSMKNETVMNEVQSWLTCQIGNVSVGSLTDRFHKQFTKYMKDFNMCYEMSMENHTQDATNQCLHQVITSCQNAPLIVLKLIRMKMSAIVKLLPLFPNMKIIHLVRDPRGILNSREQIKNSHAPKNVLRLCDSMQRDLDTTKSIQQVYSDRVKIFFYEDMAERPLKTSKAISEFSGIEFTDHMRDYIKSQTSATRDSGSFTTARKNSSKVASKWRTMLDPKYARFVYISCESSNQYLGYLPFISDDDQRNFSIPSRRQFETRGT